MPFLGLKALPSNSGSAFRRASVTPDIVLTSLEHGVRTHEALTAHL